MCDVGGTFFQGHMQRMSNICIAVFLVILVTAVSPLMTKLHLSCLDDCLEVLYMTFGASANTSSDIHSIYDPISIMCC